MKYILLSILLTGCASQLKAYDCTVFTDTSFQHLVLNSESEYDAYTKLKADFPNAELVSCEEW